MFDLVVPVFNSLHHARNCIRSILNHASLPYRLHIVDDGSTAHVSQELTQLAETRVGNAHVIRNDGNRGYLYSANRGGFAGSSPYIVFINSDTFVPPGFLERLKEAFESDPRIAVVTAVSNWANWTRVCWSIPPGHNIYSLNTLLPQATRRAISDINNASGFFFAVRREVFEALEGFDPAYGFGYWEEADFCMKVLQGGQRVVVDEGLFVYHHGWGTFKQVGRNENMERNKAVFMSRWQTRYAELERQWREGNPISYMQRDVLEDRKKYPDIFAWHDAPPANHASVNADIRSLKHDPEILGPHKPEGTFAARQRPRVIYVLPAVKIYGGIISVLQVVNQLIINGMDANVCTWGDVDDDALKLFPMFFTPRKFSSVAEMVENFPQADIVVATSWDSVYPVRILQKRRRELRACYYVQDYEPDFYAGTHPDLEFAAERTYHMIADKIVKTRWLQRKMTRFPGFAHRIPLGLNLDYFYDQDRRKGPQILALGRPQSKRRNFEMLSAVYQEVHRRHPQVSLALYGFGYDVRKLPFPCKDYGLLTSLDAVANALNESTILLDCSTFQGFGRPGLEAMACGTFPILTREGGITQYAKHEYNCLLIDPHDRSSILDAIDRVVIEPGGFRAHLENARHTAEDYSLVSEGRRTAELLWRILKDTSVCSLEPEDFAAISELS